MAEGDNECLLMVDGAARGNPGAAGCGAVILDENGAVVRELSPYLEGCSWGLKRSVSSAKNVSACKVIHNCWCASSMANTG